jgi:hypothetical protein
VIVLVIVTVTIDVSPLLEVVDSEHEVELAVDVEHEVELESQLFLVQLVVVALLVEDELGRRRDVLDM